MKTKKILSTCLVVLSAAMNGAYATDKAESLDFSAMQERVLHNSKSLSFTDSGSSYPNLDGSWVTSFDSESQGKICSMVVVKRYSADLFNNRKGGLVVDSGAEWKLVQQPRDRIRGDGDEKPSLSRTREFGSRVSSGVKTYYFPFEIRRDGKQVASAYITCEYSNEVQMPVKDIEEIFKKDFGLDFKIINLKPYEEHVEARSRRGVASEAPKTPKKTTTEKSAQP